MHNHNRMTGSFLLILLLTITAVAPTSAKLADPLLADPIFVESTTPLANQLAVGQTTPVEITFNLALNTDTVTTETLTIHGDQTGFYRGPISYPTGTQLEFSPSTGYKPGELIYVSASSDISSSGGEPLTAHTWQFTVKAGLASAEFYTHPISPTFGSGDSRKVALGDIDGDLDLDAVVANYNSENKIWVNDGTGVMSDTLQLFDIGPSSDLVLGDLDNDQDLDIVVVNEDAPVTDGTVWVNDGTGSFSAHPTTPTFVDGNSSAIALADIDGDADLDAVVANLNNQAQTVWVNDGDGVLAAHPYTPTFGLGDSYDVALGDLDNDGDIDAVVANYVSPTEEDKETVWLNDGAGGFYPHPTTPEFEGGDAQAIALGDIDADGDLDAVIANTDSGAQTVWINDGAGNFTAHPEEPSFGAGNSTGIALNDLDGDGDLDAIVSNAGSEAQSVWINRGDGIFDAHRHKPSFGSGDSAGVALGDINGDQVLDAIFANQNNEAQTVWLNEGAFLSHSPYPEPNHASVPILSNVGLFFNQLLSSSSVSTDTFMMHGLFSGVKDGTFVTSTDSLTYTHNAAYKVGEEITNIATGGIRTTIGAHLKPYLWRYTIATQPSSALFDPHPTSPEFGSGDSRAVALGDVDGDSDLDAVITNADDDPTFVYANVDGTGSFNSLSSFSTSNSSDVKLGDLDNDGDLDAVVSGITYSPSGPLPWPDTVWLNNGAGQFSAHPVAPTVGTSPTASLKLTLGDLNGDGFNDLIVVNATSENLNVWMNDGTGALSPHPLTPNFGASNVRHVALGDLDLDGDLDAVVANDDGQPQSVWVNDGDGNFSGHPTTPSFGAGDSRAVDLGDLDGDGDLDAVIANYGSGSGEPENVWLNDGTGSFTPHSPYPNFGLHYSVAVDLGDLDGDGDLDAVITNDVYYQTVWLNDGSGRFTPHPADYTFGYLFGTDAELGDIDSDGDLDTVISNIEIGSDGANTTWLNRKLDIAISKLASPDSAIPTGTISYNLDFSHTEESIAESFILTDTVPSELTDLQISATPGLVLDQLPGQPYIWEVDNSVGLASGTITVTGTIVEGLTAGTIFGNEVSIFNPADLNAANDSADVDVTVLNAAPELNPIGDKHTYVDETLTFTASASDLNWDDLTFSLVGAPANASIHPNTGYFTWSPQQSQIDQSHPFDVCVTDGNLDDCETITVSVASRLLFLPLINK